MLENSKPTIFRKHISKRTDTYKTITKNEELVETFHTFSSRMVDNTKIGYDTETLENISSYQGPVLRAIGTLKYHLTILKIKNL